MLLTRGCRDGGPCKTHVPPHFFGLAQRPGCACRQMRCAPRCWKPFGRPGHSPLPPYRSLAAAAGFASLAPLTCRNLKPPLLVGEVAARKCGRRGAGSLRFFDKMRKPPTPLRRLLRRRHLPCTAGEAFTSRRTKAGERELPGFSVISSRPLTVGQAAGKCLHTQCGILQR